MTMHQHPRHYLARAALWAPVAVAGLWPFWPGMIESRGTPLTMFDLVRNSDGWLGLVGIGGLLGLLVVVLRGLQAFDLWLDRRALRRGRAPGEARALRLGASAAIALGALTSAGWTAYHALRVDAAGVPLAVVERYMRQGAEAWRAFEQRYQQERPPLLTPVPAPGAVLPGLRRLATSPFVGQAFHISPAGTLTLLTGQDVRHYDWRASRPARALPAWPLVSPMGPGNPGAWRRERDDALIDRIARRIRWEQPHAHSGAVPFQSLEFDGGLQGFMRGSRATGYVGYLLNLAWFLPDGPGGQLLADAGLGRAGHWGVAGADSGYVVPRPARSWVYDLAPLRIVVDAELDRPAAAAFLEESGLLLAALTLVFLAALFEAVRQFRLLIAERAMTMAQSSFVSGVSHEMRTPLATMKLYAELLAQKLDAEPGQREEFVGAILTEVDRLHRLVENVLDFARISGRKRIYAYVPSALQGVLEEAIASARGPLQAAGMAVELHCPAPLTAAVDRDALVQAVANLVTNAAKYAADGGRVWVTAVPRPGGVTIEVQDFGAGIPREEQARVFQPFYRVAGTAAGGTGLGLALVREYVTAHGGWLELDSPPGRGATFRLHLPEDPSHPLAPEPVRAFART